jgi:signal recognition particle subunit SRP54
MMMVQKMGPIKNLLGMMPGMGQMREQLNQVDDRDLDRVAAIIRSMTPGERQNPKMIDGSRRARIAKGSGVTVTEVSGLVTRFFDAQKMMKRMAGGMGIPGMPGSRKAGKAAQKKAAKGRRVSGDPRKAGLAKGGSDSADAPAAPSAGGVLGNLGGRQLPPGLELPPGFDPSKFKLPGQK